MCAAQLTHWLIQTQPKYPDIVSLVGHILDRSPETSSFILDAEVVAVDPLDGTLKSFQELSNRARRDVRIDDVKVTVCVFAFDIMYLDGQVCMPRAGPFYIAVTDPITSDTTTAAISCTQTAPALTFSAA